MTKLTVKHLENLHVALWLLKDCAWCQLWMPVGIAMAAPTIAVSFFIAWHSRKSLADLIHNLAVCLWIVANITWMVGEFYFHDKTRHIARVFFFSGLITLTAYYLYELGGAAARKVRA